jgi:hypothetical protein
MAHSNWQRQREETWERERERERERRKIFAPTDYDSNSFFRTLVIEGKGIKAFW